MSLTDLDAILQSANTYLKWVLMYRLAGFSADFAEELARIDCDRTYNPRHVPMRPTVVEYDCYGSTTYLDIYVGVEVCTHTEWRNDVDTLQPLVRL